MMKVLTQILVVTTNAATSEAVVNLLRTQGYEVTSASGFQAARSALNSHAPQFVISDLRLGAFNALHLAIRQRQNHPDTQMIVLDCVHDPQIESEARRQGALYLVEPVDASDLLKQISSKLAHDGPLRRWERRAPEDLYLGAVAADQPVRIVDWSEGGVRLEAAEGVEFPPEFDLVCGPSMPVIRLKRVWARAASRGWVWCGAEIHDDDPEHVASWRRFVQHGAGRTEKADPKQHNE